jgi:hypothetical protein
MYAGIGFVWLRGDDGIERPMVSDTAAADLILASKPDAEWQRLSRRVPQVMSALQCRLALMGAGLLNPVEALMAATATPAHVRIAWEYATQFERGSPMIAATAAMLGLTDAQLDDLFVAGAAISV